MARIGRPPLFAGQTVVTLSVNLPMDMYDGLARRAIAAQLPLSGYARRVLLTFLTKNWSLQPFPPQSEPLTSSDPDAASSEHRRTRDANERLSPSR